MKIDLEKTLNSLKKVGVILAIPFIMESCYYDKKYHFNGNIDGKEVSFQDSSKLGLDNYLSIKNYNKNTIYFIHGCFSAENFDLKQDNKSYVKIKEGDTILTLFNDKIVRKIGTNKLTYTGKGITDSLLNYHNEEIQKYFQKIKSFKTQNNYK